MESNIPKHPFYDHVFKCGNTEVTRRDLESFPCPFCTENVPDKVMELIVKEMNKELKTTYTTKWMAPQ